MEKFIMTIHAVMQVNDSSEFSIDDFINPELLSNAEAECTEILASSAQPFSKHEADTIANSLPRNLHTFRIVYFGATAKLPSRTKVYSERFKQSFMLTNDDERFDNCRDSQERAVIALKQQGFNIVAIGEGDGCMYAMSDTFKPLK